MADYPLSVSILQSGRGKGKKKTDKTLNVTDSSQLNLNKSLDESGLEAPALSLLESFTESTNNGENPPQLELQQIHLTLKTPPKNGDTHLQVETSINPSKGRGRQKRTLEHSNAGAITITRSRSRSETRFNTTNSTINASLQQTQPTNFSEVSIRKETSSTKAPKEDKKQGTRRPKSNAKSKQHDSSKASTTAVEAENDTQSRSRSESLPEKRGPRRKSLESHNQAIGETLGGPDEPLHHSNILVPLISDQALNHNPRKRRSSLGSSDEGQSRDSRTNSANPLKSILRHTNTGHSDIYEDLSSGAKTIANSSHQDKVSKRPRINFKNDHDTRYYMPERHKVKSRRYNGDELRIKLLKKNASSQFRNNPASGFSNSINSGSISSSAKNLNLIVAGSPTLTGQHSSVPNRIVYLPAETLPVNSDFSSVLNVNVNDACSRTTEKPLPLQQTDSATFVSQWNSNSSCGRTDSGINFDSLTVINNLIDYIEKDVRGQVVELILSKDKVSRIFLEKMVKSKDFGKRLTHTLTTFPELNLDDLTCELMSAIVKKKNFSLSPAVEGGDPEIPGCIWRSGMEVLKQAVTEELHSPDSYHSLVSQSCSSGSVDVCGSHQRANPNLLNSSMSFQMRDLDRQLLQRIAVKIIESDLSHLDSLNKQFKSNTSTLESFRNVNNYLKQMAAETPLNLNDDVRVEADITFNSLIHLFAGRITLLPPARSSD